jgi:hypothetical protein
MAAMGSMGSRARLWLDTLSIALKRVLLMTGFVMGAHTYDNR